MAKYKLNSMTKEDIIKYLSQRPITDFVNDSLAPGHLQVSDEIKVKYIKMQEAISDFLHSIQ